MRIPPAFRDEPYASLVNGNEKIFWHQLPKVVGLTEHQIAHLIDPGIDLFPRGKFDWTIGRTVWNRRKLVAWRWAIRQDNWLADAVKFWLI